MNNNKTKISPPLVAWRHRSEIIWEYILEDFDFNYQPQTVVHELEPQPRTNNTR